MKISHKLILILTALSLFLLIISSFGWSSSKSQHASIETIYKDRVIPLRDLKIIADAYAVSIIDLVNKTNAGLTSAEDAKVELDKAAQTIKQKWAGYMATQLTVEELRMAKEANHLFITANQSVEKLTQFLRDKNGFIPDQLNDFDGELYASIDPISNKITELVNLQLDIVDVEYQHSATQYQQIAWLNISGIIIAIIASIGSLLVGSAIISQLSHLGAEPGELAAAVKQIASGKLSLKINEHNAKEGSIVKEINKMSQQLSTVMSDVNNVSSQLKNTAQQLRDSSEKTFADLHNQQQQTEQVATAMHEMTATIAEVARNAQGAAQSSLATDKEVAEGNKLVEVSLNSIVNLTNDVKEASQVITQLANDSSEIGKILEVIRSIAEQTNLLALNAAIEAARAGEQGRGFAVVADEVRTLASRTHSSTQEIQSMINRLQSGVSNAVMVMSKSLNNSHETVIYAEQIRNILLSIKVSISEINGMNLQIATATEEQTMVAGEMHRNITNISNVTHSTVASINEVNSSSKQLSVFSAELQKEISYFK